jgi:hypothetical protein
MTLDSSPIASLQQEVEALRLHLADTTSACGAHPPGHFYSPIPGANDIGSRLDGMTRGLAPRELPKINLREEQQLEILARIGTVIDHVPPFPEQAEDAFRYCYQNTQYGCNHAIMLQGMLRMLHPKRIREIGSGFSSAVMLVMSERYLDGKLSCTFIEPFMHRLDALLRSSNRERCRIYAKRVQDVDVDVFRSLDAGDILFIDSSHVVKFGSDLEHIFREVLLILARGVYIDFHDIFYPFEYPAAWIELGHLWNECYMIRAFLANNDRYQIELFSDYLVHFHLDKIDAVSPLCLKNTGANLWVSKAG